MYHSRKSDVYLRVASLFAMFTCYFILFLFQFNQLGLFIKTFEIATAEYFKAKSIKLGIFVSQKFHPKVNQCRYLKFKITNNIYKGV